MKKIVKMFLFFIIISSFFIPNVYASSIKINEITVKDKSGTITIEDLELDDDGTITSNITFNQIHDFVTFDVEIENGENTPYALESITNNNNDYLTVEYEYGKIIQPGTKGHFNVTLKYSEELINHDDITYNNLSLRLNFSNDQALINPQTSNPIQLFIKVLFLLGLLFVGTNILKKKHIKLFILLLLLIPFLIKAEEGKTISLNFNNVKVKARLLEYEIVIDLGNGEYQTVNETYGTTIEELPEPEKIGYSFTKWIDQDNREVSTDTIITGDMQLTPVYEPIQYTITYNLAGGTVTNTNPVSYNIETNTFTLNNPTKPGYTFSGWRDEDTHEVQTRVVIQQGTINNKTYTATFSTNTNTPYTVIHKQQNLSDNNYTTVETENLTGATDSTVTPQRRSYTGFTAPSGQTVTINGNGTTTVTYLYTRNTYTFSVSDRTYVTGTSNGTYKYGYSISVTAQSRAGYTFKWSDNTTLYTKSFTISSNTTLSAVYTARTDTAYTVIHQQQNIDNNNYTTVATNTYYGTTGASVTPSVNSYTGFTAPSTQTKTIAGDGSTTFTYQYNRISYTLTLTDSEYITTTTPSGSYRYGKSITLTAKTREGYTFTKWSDNTTGSTYTFTMTGNKTIGPVYEQNKVTITFNANGGTVSPASREIVQGAQIGELPTPQREDYSFVGWYTAIENGTKVETTTTFNTTTSIYALWRGSDLLYNVLKFEAEEDGVARKYTGEHQDSMDETKCTKDIYHWYAADNTEGTAVQNKNNVIFADQCWQMIRTTDTGGVKMIYNGETVDGKCLDTRTYHVGYNSNTFNAYLDYNYYYGTSYEYDSTTRSFSLSGDIEQMSWTASTWPNIVGKYTCQSSSRNSTCSTLYYVASYYNDNQGMVLSLSNSSYYSTIGNINYNGFGTLASAGYMYNNAYEVEYKYTGTHETMAIWDYEANEIYASDSIEWDEVNQRYKLINPRHIRRSDDASLKVGKYTNFDYSSIIGTEVYYIVGVRNSTDYYVIKLENGNLLSDYNNTYTYGNSFIENGDGTFTITNSDGSNANTMTTVEYNSNYSNIKSGNYICKNAVDGKCSNYCKVTSAYMLDLSYLCNTDVIKYSNDFDYLCDDHDNCKYVLGNDSVEINDITNSTLKNKINNHHYTCLNLSGECEKIYYVLTTDSYHLRSITLENGNGIEDAIDEMLYDDNVNVKDSLIKQAIDGWYKQTIYGLYDDFVEDTIFCNNRSVLSNNLGAWNPNGGTLGSSIMFVSSNNNNSSIYCDKDTDRFSISNNKAQLTYKVGLATYPEMNLLGNDNARKTARDYYLMDPYNYSYSAANYREVGSSGWFSYYSSSCEIRPTISLIPGIKYSSGNGSMETPYVIDYNSGGEEPSSVTYPTGKTKATVEVGDIVTIGTEEFYVIEEADSEDDDLKLLAHYNLNVGAHKKDDATEGIQNENVIGQKSGINNYGYMTFSRTNYWNGKIGTDYPGNNCNNNSSVTNCAYVYDDNSYLKTYVDAYKTILEGMGATIKEARLMRAEELVALGCGNGAWSCANAPAFVSETSYWLGTAFNDSVLWSVYTDTDIEADNYYSDAKSGVRPVIVI